ncbi:EpsG family protein [Propionibacterium freudenreichii]|uniref:EpsG family protein n=1 Tax=Propionibacterium freudenreichii TaxID=1744 RepID=UPI0021A58B8A|nr:EpsG family protein [Propionibacterium freudenreichii]
MMIYIVVFLSGYLFMNFSDIARVRNNGVASGISAIIAVLIPALVSGLRDPTVGTDTQGYMYDIFAETVAERRGPIAIYNAFGGDYQLGYVSLAQVSRLMPTFNAFLFITAFLTFGVAATALKLFSARHAAVSYLVYLLLTFNQSMNNSRQSVAVSFGLLLAVALLRRKRVVGILALAGAYLFHKTGLILLAYLPIYCITEWRRRYRPVEQSRTNFWRNLLILGSIVSMVGVVIEFQLLGPRLLSVLGFEQDYGVYLESYRAGVPIYLAVGQGVFVIFAYHCRRLGRGGYFLLLAVTYGGIMFFLTDISVYMYRVSMYFTTLLTLACANTYMEGSLETTSPGGDPLASSHTHVHATFSGSEPFLSRHVRKRNGGIFGRELVVLVCAALWYIQIVVWDNHGTYPYTSSILGIG